MGAKGSGRVTTKSVHYEILDLLDEIIRTGRDEERQDAEYWDEMRDLRHDLERKYQRAEDKEKGR